jgi:polyisoprenoid-binding protein YceI
MRRIDARRFPKIRGETTELKKNGGTYQIRGDLTFHGVTRAVEGEVTISAPDERSLLIEGEQVFDIRQFGVEPPKILMFRVHPDVRVRIKVVAQQQES